jgi:uncharacterized protein
MHRIWFFAVAAASALFFSACNKEAPATAAPAVEDGIPTQVQGRLTTTKLWLGPAELTAELALTLDQVRTGMMFRTNLAENDAMLFVFPAPFRASFWMKNTVIPLSAAYVAPDGTIMEIHDFQPLDTNSVVAQSDNIQFVIETTQGWFQRHQVATGMVVRSESGALIDHFHFQRNQ